MDEREIPDEEEPDPQKHIRRIFNFQANKKVYFGSIFY
jgi:hypothetical protein